MKYGKYFLCNHNHINYQKRFATASHNCDAIHLFWLNDGWNKV